jgi:hypothetical protein
MGRESAGPDGTKEFGRDIWSKAFEVTKELRGFTVAHFFV